MLNGSLYGSFLNRKASRRFTATVERDYQEYIKRIQALIRYDQTKWFEEADDLVNTALVVILKNLSSSFMVWRIAIMEDDRFREYMIGAVYKEVRRYLKRRHATYSQDVEVRTNSFHKLPQPVELKSYAELKICLEACHEEMSTRQWAIFERTALGDSRGEVRKRIKISHHNYYKDLKQIRRIYGLHKPDNDPIRTHALPIALERESQQTVA